MNYEKVTTSTQEQAVASWVNYLNQVRLDELMDNLNSQKINWEQAMDTLNDSLLKIDVEIIDLNRGNFRGMHGFIAEVAECGISNAREQIEGRMPIYEWVNDDGPIDLLRNGVPIQQKFSESLGHLSLKAVSEHYKKYPDFLSQGGKYQIPADHYEKIKYLLNMPEDQANKIPTSTGEFSMRQWKEVHEFFENGDIKFQDIEPSKLEYKQVQKGSIHETYQNEKKSLHDTNEKKRQEAYEASKPTLQQGAKVAMASAGIEGGTVFVTAIIKKRKTGKKIGEFSEKDWADIFKESGVAFVKGGIRGISIYGLTNFTATPAAVASSLCTASFGIAEQAHLFRTGKITEEQFIMNSEILCLDSSISALSSFIGQAVIPVPVLGAVIGNTVGTLIYQIAKDTLSNKEQKIIEEYFRYLTKLDIELDQRYHRYIDELNDGLIIYYKMLEKAFSLNYEEAIEGSVILAISLGIPREELLISISDIDEFFLA